MTDQLTSSVIAFTGLFLVLYDLWVVGRGSRATISWVVLTWWTLHPVVMGAVFVLIGHLFFPQCAPVPGMTEAIGPWLGRAIGVFAMGLIAYEVFCVWAGDKSVEPPLTQGFIARLWLLAFSSVMVGHLWFPQYVACVAE